MSTTDDRRRFQRLQELCDQLEPLSRERRQHRLAQLEISEPELFPELGQLAATFEPGNEPGVEPLGLAAVAVGAADLLAGETTPGQIGPYRLLRSLGVGGMGEVWEAEQSEPVQRRVAIKVLRHAAGGLDRASRFRSEQQALAAMDHPNIARVFDAGETDQGRPFFVMELVADGVPITDYCRLRGTSLEERLSLFLGVCDAIDHAHRKRVIHRDLKPSNVLVTEDAGKPLVKVIDFGIAKFLDFPPNARGNLTVAGELLGTPEYMSPEQAALGAVDVDTRSDVFTLGLLLFELIVGELPMTSEQLRRLPFDEICRHIREDDTPLPSNRMRRGTSAPAKGSVWRRVRGDLDRIVAKAMAKDRERRYRSAAQLADDVRRFLAHEPVQATPPGTIYQLRKFVRRHRAVVAALGFLIVGLSVGLGIAVEGFRRAKAAENRALSSLAGLEASESFLVDIFTQASPFETPEHDPTAGELLERGIEKLETLKDQPQVYGRLLHHLGEVQSALGNLDQAESLLLQAMTLENSADEQTIEAKIRYASVLRRQFRLEESEIHLQEALSQLAESPSESLSMEAESQLASTLSHAGRFAEAIQIYDRLVPRMSQSSTVEPLELAQVQFNAAVNLFRAGAVPWALQEVSEPIATMRRLLPEDHPHMAHVRGTLGDFYRRLGLPGCALPEQEAALGISERVLGLEHPRALLLIQSLGLTYLTLGQSDQAEATLNRLLEVTAKVLGVDSEAWLSALGHRGSAALIAGRYRQAIDDYQRAIEGWNRLPANLNRHAVLAVLNRQLATAVRSQALVEPNHPGWFQRAQAALDRAAENAKKTGKNDVEIAVDVQRAILLAQRGEADQARELFAEAERRMPNSHRFDFPQTFQFRAQLPALLGDSELTLVWLEEAVEYHERARWLVMAPEMRALAEHPRWEQLVARLNQLLEGTEDCRPG